MKLTRNFRPIWIGTLIFALLLLTTLLSTNHAAQIEAASIQQTGDFYGFSKTVVDEGFFISTMAIGPDRHLYAGTLLGELLRYEILPDGTLGPREIFTTVLDANAQEPRIILGMTFDPAATATDIRLWITHNAPVPVTGDPSAPWSGRLSLVSGPNLETLQDMVVNLPRSGKNHATNGIMFGPDGALYIAQGGTTYMGAPDDQNNFRPERLMSATVLRIDTGALTAPPLDAKTEEGGTYDPFAAGAPVTIYATGLRNPYDLVWHSNGELYVPNNASSAGGNTPATPNPLPTSCATRRIDLGSNGPYTGPFVTGLTLVPETQQDFLYRVEQFGYYGHPNPERCEWVLTGGNPTTGADFGEILAYPIGTQPDRNFRGAAYNFGPHQSPNGIIEYQSATFDGYLQGKLLVARYSTGTDIVILEPGGTLNDIVGDEFGFNGLTGYDGPLDLIEDPVNGNLYVAELRISGQTFKQLNLLRPIGPLYLPLVLTQ